MEDQIEQAVETVENVETTVENTPQVDAVEQIEQAVQGAEEAIAGEKPAQEPTFTPNFIFKAHGKEHELPEMFRGLVKDQATEKQVKEIFEKAYGMENMREKNQTFTQKIDYYEKQLVPPLMELNKTVSEINNFIAAKDFDSAFELAGIKEQDLQKWMFDKLSRKELPQEQQQIYNQNRELQKRAYEQERKLREYETAQEQAQRVQQEQVVSSLKQELDFELSQPTVAGAVKSYDSQHGIGAFQKKVAQYAAFVSETEGRELSPKEAVQEAQKFLGVSLAPSVNTAGSPKAAKPVLPNPESKGLSPVGSNNKPNSIADLRKLSQAMQSHDE